MRLINEINGIRAHLAMQRGVDTGVGVGGEDLVGTSSTATATRFQHSPRVSLVCGYSGTWYRLVHHIFIYIKVHHWYVDTFPNHLATSGTLRFSPKNVLFYFINLKNGGIFLPDHKFKI